MDEPETLGAITLAAREQLDNLIFVVNCNLQRLDGPVRGNGKIIQELEAAFRGAGWNVIKVIWGGDWDPLLAARRRRACSCSAWARWSTASTRSTPSRPAPTSASTSSASIPSCWSWSSDLTDEKLRKLRRGGHDPEKVYAAYKAAVEHRGAPTVILAKTIKGYGLGEAGEGRNVTHQQKKLNEKELREFRDRFGIPIARRRAARDALLPAARRQRGDRVPARAPRARSAASCRDAARARRAARAAAARVVRRVPRRAPASARSRRPWCSSACCGS